MSRGERPRTPSTASRLPRPHRVLPELVASVHEFPCGRSGHTVQALQQSIEGVRAQGRPFGGDVLPLLSSWCRRYNLAHLFALRHSAESWWQANIRADTLAGKRPGKTDIVSRCTLIWNGLTSRHTATALFHGLTRDKMRSIASPLKLLVPYGIGWSP